MKASTNRSGKRAFLPLALLLCLHSLPLSAGPPPEVPRDLRLLANGRTLAWSPADGASTYNVYRGTIPAAADHACFLSGVTGLSADVPGDPGGPGLLLTYLVAAVSATGEGSLGSRSDATRRPNDFPCDTDGDTLPDTSDNCVYTANPAQRDQDEDGEGDLCDPQTYHFEFDTPGARPAGMTQVGGADPTFSVRDLGGDLAAAYDESAPGVHDRFDRLPAGMGWQDVTLYIDVEEVAEACSVELWSDGAWGWNAAAGLILQVAGDGRVYFYERRGQNVPRTPGPMILPGGRLRLRLVKGAGLTSRLHLDLHDGSGWLVDQGLFDVADDHLYRGLDVVVANYLGGRRAVRRVTINHHAPPGPFTLAKHPSWSSDWKVFQRDASGDATVPLRFFYRLAEPGELRVRVVETATGTPLPGHEETDHTLPLDPTPSAGAEAAAGAYDLEGVPAGGNYDIEARLVRLSDGATLGAGVVAETAVGDVWVAGGQSNMSGYSGGLGGAETPVDAVHLFHNDGTWKRAAEPMDDGTDQADLVSAEFPAHSLMLRFAKEVSLAAGVPVGVIPGPLGGTNLFAQWQRDPADHDNRGTLYGSLLHRALLQGYEAPPVGFLWFQGESDALSSRTTADYLADFETLLGRYREDLGNPDLYAVTAQLGVYTGAPLGLWTGIQEAQRRAARDDPRVALVTTVDQPLSDAIHFTVQGYQTIGLRFAEAARAMVYGEPLDPLTEMVAARIGPASDIVELVYDGTVTGGEPSLYRVWDDLDFDPVVQSVSAAGDTVTLRMDRGLVGAAFVSYGYALDPASPWVEDTRGVPVPCFSTVPIEP